MADKKLMRLVSGQERPRGASDRALVRDAQPVYNEAQLTALKIKGAVAVGEHAMNELLALDDLRVSLAAGDPVRNQLLAGVEMETVRQVKKLQANLYNEFGL